MKKRQYTNVRLWKESVKIARKKSNEVKKKDRSMTLVRWLDSIINEKKLS